MTFLITILITSLSLIIGFILGMLSSSKLTKGIIKNFFSDAANNVLTNIASEEIKKQKKIKEDEDRLVTTNMKSVEENINTALKDLKTSVDNAKTVWNTETTSLTDNVLRLTRSHTEWANALSNTRIQGSLGEESLRTILKDLGLIEGPGFEVEKSIDRGDGKIYRPDFFVYSSNGGTIVIDSKAPMVAFKTAIDCEDELQKKQNLTFT